MKKFVAGTLIVALVALGTLAILVSITQAQEPYPVPGTSVTNIVVQNISTGIGREATGEIEYYDPEGNLDYVRMGIIIAPRASVEIKTEEEPDSFISDGWVGSAVLYSDRPLVSVTSVKYTNVPRALDGFTQGAYNGTSAGTETNRLYFPTVWRFQYILSWLTVQNIDGAPADVFLYFRDRLGNDLGIVTKTIPSYSQYMFKMDNPDDIPTNFPADFQDGSVVVTSTNNLAGAAVATWGGRSGAYQALTDADRGNTLYAPSHYRFIYNAPSDWVLLPASQWTLYSAVNLQNTSMTTTANVTATYYTRGAVTPTLVMTFTIAPLSARGLNTMNGGDFPDTDFYPLSKAGNGIPDWDGSVTITSDQPLVGTCITNWGNQIAAGIYALVAPEAGSDVLFIPAQYRIDWGSGWAQWSAINLMNVGETAIDFDDLTIEYITSDGKTVQTFSGAYITDNLKAGAGTITALAPGTALGLNTMNGGDLDPIVFDGFPSEGSLSLPRFIGGVYVTGPADGKLVGVANIIYNNRASVYNAFMRE